ncbi:MAG: hydrogenase [Proteobacteria bacterium]|nr:hydrogenase [Pseudomonadota bacterium]MBU1058129.1 hydrogenase [Pseudomonadota bacterium]
MNIFFLALLLIGVGGTQALTTFKRYSLMKTGAVLAIITGCSIGAVDAATRLLQHAEPVIYTHSWLQIFTFSLKIDAVSAFFLVPVFAISAIAALYSFQYLHDAKRAAGTAINYFFYALLIISMALVVCANNLISFALAWELMSVASFFLVIYDVHKKATRGAGYIYFIFTQAGALFIFAGFGFLYSHTGTFGFEALASIPDSAKLIAFILILIGCGSKAGIMPLHVWLPYAHPAAPSHVSAVMSGVMIKMGIYGIVRFYLLLEPTSVVFGQIVIILGISSGILGVVYAIGKQDIKKMLAYSSVENIGIILLGLGVGMLGAASGNKTMAAFGFAGGLLHVFNHSIFKSLLFMGAGSVLHQTKTGASNQLGGLMKTMPVTGRSLLIGSISISGLPPFNGFISEFLIYYGAIHGLSLHGASFVLSALAIIALAVIGALAAAAFTKFIGVVFLGEPRTANAANACEAGVLMGTALSLLAAACLIIGIWPYYFVQAAFLVTQAIPLVADYTTTDFMPIMTNISRTAALFIFLFIIVTVLRKIFYIGKEVTKSGTWGCGFTQPTVRMQYTGTSYADSMVDFFRPFIRVQKKYSGIEKIFPGKTTYSSHTLDTSEIGLNFFVVRPVLYLLSKLRWIQHGNIQLYIGYIVLAIVVMLIFI